MNASPRSLLDLLDGIEDPIYVIDPRDHRILYANGPFQRIWGALPSEARCFQVLHGRAEACKVCHHLEGVEHRTWDLESAFNGRWYRCFQRRIPWEDQREVYLNLLRDVSQWRALEVDLRAQEAEQRALYEEAPQPYLTLSPTRGVITRCNLAAARLLGLNVSTLRGRSLLDFCVTPAIARGPLSEPEGRPARLEIELQGARGQRAEVVVIARAKRDADGVFIERRVALVDITVSKREERIQAALLRLVTLSAQASADALSDALSREAQRLTRSKLSALRTAHAPSPQSPIPDEAWAEVARSQRPWLREAPRDLRAPSRELIVPIIRNQTVVALLGVAGKPRPYEVHDVEILERLAGFAWEVITRKRWEEELLVVNARYQSLMETSSDFLSYWELPGDGIDIDAPVEEQIAASMEAVCVDANLRLRQEHERESGAPLLGLKYKEIVSLDGDEQVVAFGRFFTEGYRLDDLPYHEVREGGESYLLLCLRGIVRGGRLTHVWSSARDITALKRAELELMRRQQVIELVNQVSWILLKIPDEEIYTRTLEIVMEVTGSPRGFFGGVRASGEMRCMAILPIEEGGDPPTTCEPGSLPARWRRIIRDGRPLIHNAPLSSPTGRLAFQRALVAPLLHQGRLLGLLCVGGRPAAYDAYDLALLEGVVDQLAPVLSARLAEAQEAARRAHLEAQLQQAQKLEAIGRLAGGVAHDFNNLLTVINSYAEFAFESIAEADPVRADLEQIRRAGARASALTRQLLAFSRKQVMKPQRLSLNVIISELQQMLARLIGEDIRLEVSLAPDLGAVWADPGQIEQVLMNLVVNARDAMPRGGRLWIETQTVRLEEGEAQLPPGLYAEVRVRDEGEGMEPEVCAQIFEPFFTTKDKDQGTGLGLSMVYGIVKQSEGGISVESAPGRGTTFKIHLPIKHAREGSPRTPRAMEAMTLTALEGAERILIVEDEEAVRELVQRVLSEAGYRIHVACCGEEALEVAEEIEVDLLLTDVVMPRMNGKALAQTLIARRPTLRVLYMSGYTGEAVEAHGLLDEGAPFLNKPFTALQLLREVRAALGARPS